MLVSVGRAGSVAEIKKGIEIWKKIVAGIWNFRRKLEKSRWKLDFFLFIYEICIFFWLEIAVIWLNLDKSY